MTTDLWVERGKQPATMIVNGQTEPGEEFVDAWVPVLSVLDSGRIVVGQEIITGLVMVARNTHGLTVGGVFAV